MRVPVASSFGCAICDPVLALWCFAGGPSIFDWARARLPRKPVTPIGPASE